MKKLFFVLYTIALFTCASAQTSVENRLKGVTIYDGTNQSGAASTIGSEQTLKDGNIPNSLNNKVSSIRVARGWKVTLADNSNGSSPITYEARNNEKNVNLGTSYNNKVSYIKVQKLWGGSIYSGNNQTGTRHQLKEGIYSGSGIPGGLNDKILSIKVHKGFMMTIAQNSDGTDGSRNYIARTQDLNVNAPITSASFVRIVPWRDVKKKGLAGKAVNNDNINVANKVGAKWFYNWNTNLQSQLYAEYVPLRDWNWDDNWVTTIKNIPYVTHVNLFNEPDNSNQDNPRTEKQAADQHKYPLKTGLRIGSPACEENWEDWMCEYFDEVKKDNNKRIDYVNLHWYDWAGYTSGANSSAQAIGDRFLAYIDNAHDETGLPIWITEFNANPNRNATTQKDFLNYVLPKLESRSHVERYAYFICSNNCQFLDANGNLTDVGKAYKNASTSNSIPEATWKTPIASVKCISGNARYVDENEVSDSDIVLSMDSDELENLAISIAPNPVADQLIIKGVSEDAIIRVYGLNGQLMKSGYGSTMNVSDLNSGTYIMNVQGLSLRFLKQ